MAPQQGTRTLLDVAAGSGRHARWAAELGYRVTAVDRDAQAFSGCGEGVETRELDLEGPVWPLLGQSFDVVICTHYLYRPHLDALVDCLAVGGRLIFETFARGNERFGRPSNPDYLLVPGELLALAARRGLYVLAYEDGLIDLPRPARVQRIVLLNRPSHAVAHAHDDTIQLRLANP